MSESQRKVLVVDDEPDIAAYLQMLLEDAGYATVTASNGREGLQKAKAERPDLVCLDITMPEESGIRLYRNLREDPDLGAVPIFLVTAVTGLGGDPEPFRQFMSSRKQMKAPDGFFAKPIDRQQFLTKVRETLG